MDQRDQWLLLPYLIYHVSHERNVFPQLGISSDDKVVAHAMPKVEVCLRVLERELGSENEFLCGSALSLADFYMLPIVHAFGFAPEGQAMYPTFPGLARALGSVANPETVPGCTAAAGSDRACAPVGRRAPPEILKPSSEDAVI